MLWCVACLVLNGAFLFEEAQCGEHLGSAPCLGTLEDMLRKALDMGISLHRGPIGKPGENLFTRTFERKGMCICVPFLD